MADLEIQEGELDVGGPQASGLPKILVIGVAGVALLLGGLTLYAGRNSQAAQVVPAGQVAQQATQLGQEDTTTTTVTIDENIAPATVQEQSLASQSPQAMPGSLGQVDVAPQNMPNATAQGRNPLGDTGAANNVALTTVHFAFDSTDVQTTDRHVLNQFATKITNMAGDLLIEGHTDNIGPEEYNHWLSEARAQQVADWLKASGMADIQRKVSIKGYGSKQPVNTNTSLAGQASNRRVELRFYPTL